MIIKCVAYKNGERLGDIAVEDISEVITQPDTFIWMGLFEPEESLLKTIQQEFGLHDLAIDDARNAHQQPKIEHYAESLFIVVKTVQLNQEKVEYGETHFFVGKDFLISLRHGASSSYTPIREHWETNPKMLKKGPSFALYAILDSVVDNYQKVVAQFESDFNGLEESIFKGEFDRLAIGRLYDLKRQLLQLRNAVLPVEEICGQLIRFHEDLVPKELKVYFRDIQDHATHVVSRTDSMREMLTTAMQVNLGIVAIGQNDIVKGLAGWGAILAIPTVLFSLYGMNFKVMPELQWRYGYPAVLLITLCLCLWLYKKLKNAGWL